MNVEVLWKQHAVFLICHFGFCLIILKIEFFFGAENTAEYAWDPKFNA